jgi:hypothetical protein
VRATGHTVEMWKRQQKPAEWMGQFTQVVRSAARDETLDFVSSAARLRAFDGVRLVRFDEAARRIWWYSELSHLDRAREVLKEALKDSESAELLLFLEASNSNGYIREKALRALRGYPGRLTCAATLLRADDWVPQVATLAENMLADIAETERAHYLFEFIDLILALRRRSRFERIWPAIQRSMLAPQWRAQRLAGMQAAQGEARQFAYELSLNADTDLTFSSLKSAAADASPAVSLWALANAAKVLAPDELLEILREGLANRMSFVRSDAMRRYLRGGFEGARELLLRLALDPSHAVRGTAAHYLRENHGEEVLPLWRSTLDAGRMVDAMTLSLSEHGETQDMERLRRQLTARRARTRAAALRGLWRLGHGDMAALLNRALHDGATLTASAALRIYRQGTDILDRTTLESAISQAKSPGLKACLLSASRLLPKWERLGFLLNWSIRCPDDADAVEIEIGMWLQSANRSFSQLSPTQDSEIRDLLARLRRERLSSQLDLVAFHL